MKPIDMWLAALRSPYGKAIGSTNRMLLRQHLYKARLAAKNPELDSMIMLLPEQADEIWLVHKHATDAGANN